MLTNTQIRQYLLTMYFVGYIKVSKGLGRKLLKYLKFNDMSDIDRTSGYYYQYEKEIHYTRYTASRTTEGDLLLDDLARLDAIHRPSILGSLLITSIAVLSLIDTPWASVALWAGIAICSLYLLPTWLTFALLNALAFGGIATTSVQWWHKPLIIIELMINSKFRRIIYKNRQAFIHKVTNISQD